MASNAKASGPVARVAVNEVVLVGRLAAEAVERALPSGDVIWTWRLIIERPEQKRTQRNVVDTIDCATYLRSVGRRLARWSAGDVIEVNGSIRRRFFKSAGAPTSRYEVECARATRVLGS